MPAEPADVRALDGDRGMTDALEPSRYHALDRVRALAMLLGVVYHTMIFRMFTGGGFPGSMGRPDGSKLLGDWMHSFRMPLFFLIAGFFGRMMRDKYGTTGVPPSPILDGSACRLLIGIFTFGPAYVLTRELISSPPELRPRRDGRAAGTGPDAPAGRASGR